MKPTISSKKAAAYFNVNESTIKRWADSGTLKCHKTEGGHRKFLPEDLRNYAEQNDYQTNELLLVEKNESYKKQILNRDYALLCNRLEKIILKGDSNESYKFLYNLYVNDYSLDEIFDEIIKPTMYEIGQKWISKKLRIENEHIASNTILTSLHQLERSIVKRKPNNKTVICAGFENEFHEIGLLCVKIALEADGWNVIYPGTNLPFQSIAELLVIKNPKIICISSTYVKDFRDYENKINFLINLTAKNGTKLIFGGGNNVLKKLKQTTFGNISDMKKYIKKL